MLMIICLLEDDCEDDVFEMTESEPSIEKGSDFAAPSSPARDDGTQHHIRRPMNAFMIFRYKLIEFRTFIAVNVSKELFIVFVQWAQKHIVFGKIVQLRYVLNTTSCEVGYAIEIETLFGTATLGFYLETYHIRLQWW